jgi:hypothetical protein
MKYRRLVLIPLALCSMSLAVSCLWARGFGGYHGGGFGGGYHGGGFGGGYHGGGFEGGYHGGGFAGGYHGGGFEGGYHGTGMSSGYHGTGMDSGYHGTGMDSGYHGTGMDSGYHGTGIDSGYHGTGIDSGYHGTGIDSGYHGTGFGSGYQAGGFGAGMGGFRGGDFGAAPSRGDMNRFLGMPSDEGMQHLGGDNFNVQHGAVEGPRGGVAAGTTVTGPRGNEVGRGVAVGPNGGVAAGSAVRGADGGVAGRGIAVGPDGGFAGGFGAMSASGRYVAAAGVRGGFNDYGIYGAGWFGAHPGVWYPAGWAAGYAWTAASWGMLGGWMGYSGISPNYYNYGSNVTYNDGAVYYGDQMVGTSSEYYQQASSLAAAGAAAPAPTDGDWMPLGVFALSRQNEASSNLIMQLAVSKQGMIAGNYTDTITNHTLPVHGSVDKQTQRVAWTVGDNKKTVAETGLYNLTKDEAPVLIHTGGERTEQWLLVRLKQPATANPTTPVAAQPST